MSAQRKIWHNGSLVDWDEATLHVGSHGLHYGMGFFEGLRCHATPAGPAIFRLTDHLARLARSAAAYLIPLPYGIDDLGEACRQVVRANELTDCYLRPVMYLGTGENPFRAPWHISIIPSANGPLVGAPKDTGVRAKVSSFNRIATNVIPPAAKATGQYLNSYLAQLEAVTSGYDEAVLLNTQGQVTDGWAHNLFTVRDGVLTTPSLSSGALAGVVRDTLLTLAAEAGIAAGADILTRTDLYFADECFLTGTAAGIVPVVNVDGRPVGDGKVGPITQQLTSRYAEVITGATADHADWRELV
ncbi:branched-chain amino acid transaminase [Actinokineospora sp.]|uniref:branched-chain amino acid transaminase n=1 Tax=Actinokineospora sp. TaxID=1872133 RepID=UPI0040380109